MGLANIAILMATMALASGSARADCAPPPDAPPMCLTGTIISPGYMAALIELAGRPGVETVKLNGQVLDWQVVKIMPRAVLLGQNDQQVTLTLGDRDAAPTETDGVQAQAEVEPSESIAAHSMKLRQMRKQARQSP